MVAEYCFDESKKATRLPLNGGERDFIIYMGGALGTDHYALRLAQEYGCRPCVKVPPHHFLARHRKEYQYVHVLEAKVLREADPYLKMANQHLKRVFPCQNPQSTDLLRRNFHIIKEADCVYAFRVINHKRA